MQKLSGEEDIPSSDPIPSAPIFAPTALKLNVTPPKKILVTALNKANGEEGMRGGAEHPQIFRWIDAFDTAINDMLILNKFYILFVSRKNLS